MIEINNPKFFHPVVNAISSFQEEAERFHELLMKQGVKAYRCNDGWVDRENQKITFFHDERQKGYYWGKLDLQIGDLIYLGSASDSKGKVARITGVFFKGTLFSEFKYKLIKNTSFVLH